MFKILLPTSKKTRRAVNYTLPFRQFLIDTLSRHANNPYRYIIFYLGPLFCTTTSRDIVVGIGTCYRKDGQSFEPW
jgi:hypothetical protein